MERSAQEVGVLRDVRLLTPHRSVSARPALAGCLFAALWLVSLIGAASSSAFAQLTATPANRPPPDEVTAPLRARLAPASTVVRAGAAELELWLVSEMPMEGAGPADWSRVAEGALVGAMRVTGPFKEIRGKTVKPGVYTLRFGLQPQNGDHLGASPNREYLLLSPAAVDVNPAPLGFDGTVAISKQTIGTSHPAALSLDPPITDASLLSPVTSDLDHRGLVFEVRTSHGGALRFGLILIGVIEH